MKKILALITLALALAAPTAAQSPQPSFANPEASAWCVVVEAEEGAIANETEVEEAILDGSAQITFVTDADGCVTSAEPSSQPTPLPTPLPTPEPEPVDEVLGYEEWAEHIIGVRERMGDQVTGLTDASIRRQARVLIRLRNISEAEIRWVRSVTPDSCYQEEYDLWLDGHRQMVAGVRQMANGRSSAGRTLISAVEDITAAAEMASPC